MVLSRAMEHTKKNLIIMTLLNLLLLACYGTLFFSIRSMNLKVHEIAAKIETLREREEKESAIESIVSNTEKERNELDKYIFSKNNLVPFIEYIEKLANESDVGITLKSVDLALPMATSTSGTFKIEAEVTGAWNEVFRFTALLGSIPYKVEFTDFIVETTGESARSSWRGTYRMNIPTL